MNNFLKFLFHSKRYLKTAIINNTRVYYYYNINIFIFFSATFSLGTVFDSRKVDIWSWSMLSWFYKHVLIEVGLYFLFLYTL